MKQEEDFNIIFRYKALTRVGFKFWENIAKAEEHLIKH